MAGLSDIYDELVGKIVTPGARLLLVENLKKEASPQTVIDACKKMLDAFPDDIGIRSLLAETYFEEGSLDFAERETEEIVKQINQLSSIFKFQSELFRKQNKLDDAIQSLKLYLAHNEGDQQAADLLADLSRPREEPSALPTSTLAELYYKQGELDEAIQVYEQVVADSPENETAKLRLDELKGEKGQQTAEVDRTHLMRERKVKLLGVLERWLAAVEERKAAGRA
ncbi:MAG: tetratricopeptide repeat protein [Thermodesulfobacteriota bacterium]